MPQNEWGYFLTFTEICIILVWCIENVKLDNVVISNSLMNILHINLSSISSVYPKGHFQKQV